MAQLSGTVKNDYFSDAEDSDRDQLSDDEGFALHDYDLDVVDDAIINAHNSEFLDHFGFKIQVKTDDEESDDSSGSDLDSDDEQPTSTADATSVHGFSTDENEERPTVAKSSNNASRERQHHRHSSGSSVHHKSLFSPSASSDDDGHSIDTAMTTPTAHKQHHLSLTSVEPLPFERSPSNAIPAVPPSSNDTVTTKSRRGRSMTVSRPSDTIPTLNQPPLTTMHEDNVISSQQDVPTSTRRARAATVSRPSLPNHSYGKSGLTDQPSIPDTVAEDPDSNRQSSDTLSSNSVKQSFDVSSNHARSPSQSSGISLSNMNPFKRSSSPSPSIASQSSGTYTVPTKVTRPSQAYRERQSKRMSEFSNVNTTSYYAMLLSKFRPSLSDDHAPDSAKHAALKSQALEQINILRRTEPQAYDYDFWETAVTDFDKVVRTQHAALRHHLMVGIPPSMRGMLWQIFSRAHNNGDIQVEYKALQSRTSPHEKLIRRDLARTFPTHEFFREQHGEGQEALFKVMKAYGIFDQEVGYCQGLPFVVGCLLLHMPDDAAFCVLVKLMSHYGLRGLYTSQMELLLERLYQFDHLLQQKLPEVHSHLERQEIKPSMYASQWFMTFFAYRCPLPLVYRVLDLVFVEGLQVVLQFALALMQRNQNAILKLDFEAILKFFSENVYDVYKDDTNAFVRDAYEIDISPRLLARLSKQHAAEIAREAKRQSQEENLRQINAQLGQQVEQIENKYKTLEMEHQEMTRQAVETKMNMARMNDENQELRRQLGQMRHEFEELKLTMERNFKQQMDEMDRKNTDLTRRNQSLEQQLAETEAMLINFKVEYAQRESDYEQVRKQWHTLQHRTSTE